MFCQNIRYNESMTKKENRWVTLIKMYGMLDAQILAGRLETEEIPVRIIPLEAGHRLGLSVGKLAEVAVQIPESFIEPAEEILNTDYSDESEFEEEDEKEDYEL